MRAARKRCEEQICKGRCTSGDPERTFAIIALYAIIHTHKTFVSQIIISRMSHLTNAFIFNQLTVRVSEIFCCHNASAPTSYYTIQ